MQLPNAPPTACCRATLLSVHMVFMIVALLTKTWVISVPVGKLGGYKKFSMGLRTLCTLPRPTSSTAQPHHLTENDATWWFSHRDWDAKKHSENAKFRATADRLLHTHYPYATVEFENVLMNPWSRPQCTPLSDEFQNTLWPLFPKPTVWFRHSMGLNRVLQYSLYALAGFAALNWLLGVIGCICGGVARPLLSPKGRDEIIHMLLPATARPPDTEDTEAKKRLRSSSCRMVARAVLWFENIFMCLDCLVFAGTAASVLLAEIYFRPIKTHLSTATLHITNGQAFVSLWIAMFAATVLFVFSLRRLASIQQECLFTLLQ